SLLAFYRAHQVTGIETVSEASYERLFKIGKALGLFWVSHDKGEPQLQLQVAVDDPTVLFTVVQKVRQMFDLDSDPLLIANSFQSDTFLASLWKQYPGLRIARGWDPFETAICTLLGQHVSLRQGRTLVHQLVQSCGEKIVHPVTGKDACLFPSP